MRFGRRLKGTSPWRGDSDAPGAHSSQRDEEMRHSKARPVISGDRHSEVAAREERSLNSLDILLRPNRATSLCPNRARLASG